MAVTIYLKRTGVALCLAMFVIMVYLITRRELLDMDSIDRIGRLDAFTNSNYPSSNMDIEAGAEKHKVLLNLNGPSIKADDSRLVSAISKYMIDYPRPYLSKFSYPLFETPQAKEVMKILNKVSGDRYNSFSLVT